MASPSVRWDFSALYPPNDMDEQELPEPDRIQSQTLWPCKSVISDSGSIESSFETLIKQRSILSVINFGAEYLEHYVSTHHWGPG